jgi:GrpB-like predicted nucleotidyltransferase (UPF0157 family)
MIGPNLVDKLRRAGMDPAHIGDPEEAWLRLHDVFGMRATLIDRYELEAHSRGVEIEAIPEDERRGIAERVIATHIPGMELLGESGGDPVEVVPYDASWPELFSAWKERLAAALAPAETAIYHIGSTSVEGLAAKPVIDVLVLVPDVDDEDGYVPAIESCGVLLRSREPDHRYFRPQRGSARVVQVHVADEKRGWGLNHLLFRDYLRTHPRVRDAYADVKRRLAVTYRDDRLAYNEGKTVFILDTLEAAEHWASRVGWKSE